MSYLTYKDVRFICPWEILHMVSFQAEIKPNKHASIKVRVIVEEDTVKRVETQLFENASVELRDDKGKVLFAAEITKVQSIYENGVCYIEIEGLSGTSNLDIKKKSRSFQDVSMTYSEMVNKILQDTQGTSSIYTCGEGTKINLPLVQFRETDWTYIKRMVSHFKGVLVPEVTSVRPRFWFGMPEGRKQEIEKHTEYKMGREETLGKSEFFYYAIKTWKNMDVGDRVIFKDKPMMVYEKTICLEDDLFVFRYRLCYEGTYESMKKHNHSIVGMAILGNIIETKQEQMKLHLDIDQQQEASKAYWYDYVPTTGNMMYCMPKVGTRVALYFPDEEENHAKVHYCVRTNGSGSANVSTALQNPECRYFYTEHNKAWALLPSNLYFESIQVPAAAKKLKLELIDGQGVDALDASAGSDGFLGIRGLSSKKVFLMAMDELRLSSHKYINLAASACLANYQWGTLKQSNSAHILANDHHFLANKVYLDTISDGDIYSDFDDAPKKGHYNWWSIIGKAVIGVALIAAGVAVIVSSVITGPVGLIAAGALIGAGISSCSVAYDEYSTGNTVGLGEYAIKLGIGFVTGAIAAIPGVPAWASVLVFGTASTCGGMALEELLLGEDYGWDDYVIQGVVAAAFNTLSLGLTKIFANKIRVRQQAKINAQQLSVDDQIAQVNREIMNRYGSDGAISGSRIKDLYLKNLPDDELVRLCQELNVPCNPQHPKFAINDLKRALVQNTDYLRQAEMATLKTQRAGLQTQLVDLDTQYRMFDKYDIKAAKAQNGNNLINGIAAYNNNLKGNIFLPADGFGDMVGNVLNSVTNTAFDYNDIIDGDQNSKLPNMQNQAMPNSQKNSFNLPTSNPSQENEIGNTIWEKVYNSIANVEPNFDAINKVETVKMTFGLEF